MFETPEKRSDGSFLVSLKEPQKVEGLFRWASQIVPDLKIQPAIQSLREYMLKQLVQNRVLFKQAPSLDSLRAITPVWGMLIRNGSANGNAKATTVEWSAGDMWEGKEALKGRDVQVQIALVGIQISRQSILPVWSLLPVETAGIIDLEFESVSEEADAESVGSSDLPMEEGLVELKDPAERKRQHKEYARDLLRKAAEVQMQADAAVERFYMEYDLSDDESNVSEESDESDADE